MKKVLLAFIFIVILIYFKLEHFSFLEFSDSLDQGEIGVTFIDDSLLLISLENKKFLLSLDENVSKSIIQKYHLENLQLYNVIDKPVINQLDITYADNLEFSFVYASKKFCVGNFYDCDFTYLYQNTSYIDADIYFYNKNTVKALNNIDSTCYSIKPIISILWDQKNYMIVTH